MSTSTKRKMPAMGLQRRVKPRREDKWEPEPDVEDESPSEDDDVPEHGIGNDAGEEESNSGASEDEEESEVF